MKTLVKKIAFTLILSVSFFSCQIEADPEPDSVLPKKPGSGYSKGTFKKKAEGEISYYQFKPNYWPGVPSPYDTYIENKIGGGTSGAGPLDQKYHPDEPGAGGPSEILGDAPSFRLSIADQVQYPKFANLVRNVKYFVLNDPAVLNSLIKWSGMTREQILDRIEFGFGPTIVVKQLYYYFGLYRYKDDPNAFYVDKDWVQTLESTSDKGKFQTTSFALAVTILHESVHQARHQMGLDKLQEYGEEFEKSAFGMVINEDNIEGYTYKLFKK